MRDGRTIINRVVFVGSKPIGLKCLKTAFEHCPNSIIGVLTFDDSSDSRSVLPEFISYCSENRITLFIAKNRSESEKILIDLQPEMCLVVGWYWLISKELLAIVPNGFIGLHNSLLPKYRGGSPLVWALINGEKELGATLFSFTEGMDDGNLWGHVTVKVEEQDTIGDILEKLEASAIGLIAQVFPAIIANKIQSTPQNHSEATFCALRTAQDGWIDWSKKAVFIHNFIRAQSTPYPGAYTLHEGTQLIIWKAQVWPGIYYGTPGQVARILENGVIVICGDNTALLLEVVGINEQKFSASEILKSIKQRFPIASCVGVFK
jgi:methionyl-tRNA formyltransferase